VQCILQEGPAVLVATKTCLVCKTLLPFLHGQANKLCSNPQCQGKYASLLPHQICAICGRLLTPRELASGVCADPDCQRSIVNRRELQKAEALREEVRKLRDLGAPAVGIKEPESYPLTLLPSFTAPVSNVPERRRRALRDHVTLLISQATMGQVASDQRPVAAPPAPAPTVQAVLGQACGQCHGNCCRRGGDHAYLKVATIRRYLETHPGLRPRDVLAAYLARVGNKTYKDSCIFHRPDGCALPRDMRSDICNQYFCDELKAFQNDHSGAQPVRGFFASACSGTIRNAAFIDETEVRSVPLTTPTLVDAATTPSA